MTDGAPAQPPRQRAAPFRLARLAAVIVLAAASILYMGTALARARGSLHSIAWLAHPGELAASIAIQAVSLTLGCRIWFEILQRIAPSPVTAVQHWRIWALTNPTRYIPGRIWHVASLAAFMRSAGVTPVAMLTSIVVHMWLYVLAACAMGLVLLPVTPASVAGAVAVLCGVAAGTHPRPLRAMLHIASRLSGQPALEWRSGWLPTLALVAADVGIHSLNGLGVSTLLGATMDLPVSSWLHVAGANAIAFLAGYASMVPAGLGVREATLTALLEGNSMAGGAAAAALVVRAAATFVEVLLALVAGVMPRAQGPVTGA
ncbi:MAG: hypothetical protein JWM95_3185 [Gemmatimonadetes bacterium]|nr:hypothetical protein [Gemmatimonadota bacterium]